MANARDIQNRIKSVQDTMKITNAMYLISSTKVKKAKRALTDAEPHFYESQKLIGEILRDLPAMSSRYFDNMEPGTESTEGKIGYLILSGDKGLAGAYNHNVLKLAEETLHKTTEKPELYVVGRMGRGSLIKAGYDVVLHFDYAAQDPTVERSRLIAEYLIDRYNRGYLNEIHVVYTRMINAGESAPEVRRLLPLKEETFLPEDLQPQQVEYLPTPEEVMHCVVPNYITGYVYGALVEAFCSEENSRMLAMKAATDSAGKMLRELSVIYNSVRQAAITQQIVEVAGGAQAQKRKKSS